MRTKQVIVIRKDLKMRRGKEIAQGAHAAGLWLMNKVKYRYDYDTFSASQRHWIEGDYRKIVVTVNSEEALLDLHCRAQQIGLEAHIVTDLGLTEFDGVLTVTALAIGPDTDENVSMLTEGLPLY